MTPLKQENLELKLEDNIAYMTVTGLNSQETFNQGLDWFKNVSEANDNFNLCVDMVKTDFNELSEMSESFKRIGNVLRMVPSVERCALLTDSRWVKNSAKIESAVIPGTEVQPFDLDEKHIAENWLGHVRSDTQQTSNDGTEKAGLDRMAKNTSVLGAPESEIAKINTEKTTAKTTDKIPDNPWDNFSVKNLDL